MQKSDFILPPQHQADGSFVLAFSTRAAGDFTDADTVARAAGLFNAERLLTLRQVHGVEIVDTARAPLLEQGAGDYNTGLEADGWAGELVPDVLYGVRTADCLPVALWDDGHRLGAMLHAGWRSAVSHICARAVALLEERGVDPSGLNASLGPSIGGSCYEVGDDVAEAAGHDRRWLAVKGDEKYLFDVRGYVFHELAAAGLQPGKIEVSSLCTHCEAGRFYSHRARGERGRMVSFMGRLK